MTGDRPPGLLPLREVIRHTRNPGQLAVLTLIRGYQLTLSPVFGPICRFYPSCSRYGFEAVHLHGTLHGTLLTARRLLRCHPWNPGGVDPVPPASRRRGRTEQETSGTPAGVVVLPPQGA